MNHQDLLLQSILQIVIIERTKSKKVSKAIKAIHDEFIMYSDKLGVTMEELKKQLNFKI